MKNKIDLIGLKGIPIIKPGDTISQIVLEALKSNDITLKDGDILVIAQTIISKSNGRIRHLKSITPSRKAIEIYNTINPIASNIGIPIKSPELIQAILEESNEIVKKEHVLITETRHGFICANAGIDQSNVEGKDNITLLPNNPDGDANEIRKALKKTTGKNIAVIISDSFGRPFRVGAVGVALGIAGINAILDKRGSKDLFGYELQSTIVAQVDNLASAAQLIMGEADEGLPVVIIRGYEFEFKEDSSIKLILREKNTDLFRRSASEILAEILKNRRSYKIKFDSREVDPKIIQNCIALARWAPSAHNGQYWRYILLEKGNIRNELINNMNLKLRQDLEKDGKSETFINKKIEKTRENFLESPILVLLCLDTTDLEKYGDLERYNNEYLLGVQSISASAAYFLLAVSSEKLAACWYCAPLFTRDIVKMTLQLPSSYEPMAFFTVGYPIKKIEAPARKNLNNIIFKLNNMR